MTRQWKMTPQRNDDGNRTAGNETGQSNGNEWYFARGTQPPRA